MVETILALMLYFVDIYNYIIKYYSIIMIKTFCDGTCVFHMYVSVNARGDDFRNKYFK